MFAPMPGSAKSLRLARPIWRQTLVPKGSKAQAQGDKQTRHPYDRVACLPEGVGTKWERLSGLSLPNLNPIYLP